MRPARLALLRRGCALDEPEGRAINLGFSPEQANFCHFLAPVKDPVAHIDISLKLSKRK
jgi:hypothetical protein